jgi:hypothetical protein
MYGACLLFCFKKKKWCWKQFVVGWSIGGMRQTIRVRFADVGSIMDHEKGRDKFIVGLAKVVYHNRCLRFECTHFST